MRATRRAMISLIAGGLFLFLSQTNATAQLIPPNDDDILEIEKFAKDARRFVPWDHCLSSALKPRLESTRLYLESMQAWLRLARRSYIEQLKSLAADEIRNTNRTVSLQHALMVSQFFFDLSDAAMQLANLGDGLRSLLRNIDPNFRWRARYSWKDPKLVEDVQERRAMQNPDLIPEFLSSKRDAFYQTFLTIDAKIDDLTRESSDEELAKYSSVRTYVSSLADVKAAAKKVFDYKYTGGHSWTNIGGLIVDALSEIAKAEQAGWTDEMKELANANQATQTARLDNFKEYARLHARAMLIEEFLDWDARPDADWVSLPEVLQSLDQVACHNPCPEDPQAPTGLAYGGTPFDDSGKVTYGAALRTFTAETTLQYAYSLNAVKQKWLERLRKDPPWIRLVNPKSQYKVGEPIEYAVHAGPTCHGAKVLIGSLTDDFSSEVDGIFDDEAALNAHRTISAEVPGNAWLVVYKQFRDVELSDKVGFQVIGGIDPCLVGSWETRDVSQFAGVKVSFTYSGRQTVDYTNAKPLQAGNDTIAWQGIGTNFISTQAGTAKIEGVRDGSVTMTLKTGVMPMPVTWKMGAGMGFGGLGNTEGNHKYACSADSLEYEGSTRRDGKSNMIVKLTRTAGSPSFMRKVAPDRR